MDKIIITTVVTDVETTGTVIMTTEAEIIEITTAAKTRDRGAMTEITEMEMTGMTTAVQEGTAVEMTTEEITAAVMAEKTTAARAGITVIQDVTAGITAAM